MDVAGCKSDFQLLDWQSLLTLRAKKAEPAKGGWHLFRTDWTAGDSSIPLAMAMFTANGRNGWFG